MAGNLIVGTKTTMIQLRYAIGTKDMLDKYFKGEDFSLQNYIVKEGKSASQYLWYYYLSHVWRGGPFQTALLNICQWSDGCIKLSMIIKVSYFLAVPACDQVVLSVWVCMLFMHALQIIRFYFHAMLLTLPSLLLQLEICIEAYYSSSDSLPVKKLSRTLNKLVLLHLYCLKECNSR